MLWVWHPRTGRQTLIFATPGSRGRLLLWSPGGQGDAGDLDGPALKETLDSAEPGRPAAQRSLEETSSTWQTARQTDLALSPSASACVTVRPPSGAIT